MFLRWQQINGPDNGKFTWMSAHVLNTMKVWEKGGGPQEFHYAPVYTYPEEGNKHIPLGRLPGLFDAQGNYYYVSYPPGGFLVPYYFFEALDWEKDIQHMRYFALFLHVLSALLFLLLLKQLCTPLGISPLTMLLGGLLPFLFAMVYLHYFLHFYFADLLFLPVFLLQCLAIVFWERNNKSTLVMLFITFFLFFIGAFIDWMGWITVGVFCCLVIHRSWKSKNVKATLFLFPGIFALALAFGLMYEAYASIAGPETFKELLLRKLFIRSGISGEELTSHGATLFSGKAWWNLMLHFVNGFGMFLPMLLIVWVIGISKKFNWKSTAKKMGPLLLLFVALVVVLHSLLLFNFNALHDFSVMKTGLLLILLGLLAYHALGEVMDLTRFHKVMVIGLILAVLQNGYAFVTLEKHPVTSYPEIADKIKAFAAPEDVVFLRSGMMYDPALELLAERNVMLKMSPLSATGWLKEHEKNSGIFIYANQQHTDSILRITADGKKTLIFSHAQNP
jgi:hypothetical protein